MAAAIRMPTNNSATAEQLIELSSLQMKRLQPVADQEQVKEAIRSKDHPFWDAFALAVATLAVVAEEKVQVALEKIIEVIKQITTGVVGEKKTADCFTSKDRYYHRDGDLDNWLPETQAEQPSAIFSVNKIRKESTFKEMAEEIVGAKGNVKKLSQIIIERKHTTTLPTIESLIERQEGGEDVGLRTDGWANFFFVEDNNGDVSVVRVGRHGGRWGVSVRRLGCDDRWSVERRVFVRNS
ncbi:MAG: hypothetical protein Q8Q03_00805 [bacterium]|nr:hypothetical protein [bacterium]